MLYLEIRFLIFSNRFVHATIAPGYFYEHTESSLNVNVFGIKGNVVVKPSHFHVTRHNS